jgi:hypothetical protein
VLEGALKKGGCWAVLASVRMQLLVAFDSPIALVFALVSKQISVPGRAGPCWKPDVDQADSRAGAAKRSGFVRLIKVAVNDASHQEPVQLDFLPAILLS